MNYYILGVSEREYKKETGRQKGICVAALAAAAAVNLLFCFLRTDELHLLFLILNIVTDTAAAGFVFFLESTQISLRKRLYAVASREKRGTSLRGVITEIEETTEMVYGLECYEVVLETEKRQKVFAAKDGAVPFRLTGHAALVVVDNIIVRAEVER